MYILTVDIGNTQTVFAVFGEKGIHSPIFRIPSQRSSTVDELYVLLEMNLRRIDLSIKSLQKVVLASVVPELKSNWESLFESQYLDWIEASYKSKWNFQIAIPQREQVGSDRLANAQAALRFGVPAIVVDAGTATTFDVVEQIEESPAYVGGIIVAGVQSSLDSLIRKTSLLSPLSLKQKENLACVGNSTETAMASGVYHGFAAMVDGLVDKICTERKYQDIPVIATGGYASLLKNYSKSITHYEPNLTLEGLYELS